MSSADTGVDTSPKAHYGKVDDPRLSAEEMDFRRKENIAYEYLCHLEEAKVWIEACINETLPTTTELEEGLRNGVYLAKLGHFMAPEVVLIKKIYDRDQARFNVRGLHFRHTDNINHWLKGLENVGLPKIFYPETTDIYDRKNMPRVIYCIHALSLYLFKLGKAPQIQDLYGKIKFTDEEISAMRKELEKYGIQMPAFSKIGGILANEMPVDEAALHAAIIAINEAIDKRVASETLSALHLPAAHLNNIHQDILYQDAMFDAKETKAEIARNKSMDPDSSYVPDVYDELLTQAELQGNINLINTNHGLTKLVEAVEKQDKIRLKNALQLPYLNIRDVKDEFVEYYMENLVQALNARRSNNNNEDLGLTKEVVQMMIRQANSEGDAEHQRVKAIQAINEALEKEDEEATLKALQNPKAQLPNVQNFAGPLYKDELRCMKYEKQASLDYEELYAGVQVLSAVAEINKAVDIKDAEVVVTALCEEDAHISNIDHSYSDKYMQAILTTRDTKRKRHSSGLVTHFEIQQCVNQVNNQAMEETNQIQAIGKINEAVDSGVVAETIAALQMKTACIKDVDPKNAVCYQHKLTQYKAHKAEELQDPSTVLWYQDIQDTIHAANSHVDEAQKMSVAVAAINLAISANDQKNLTSCLMNSDIQLHSVTPQCIQHYITSLQKYKDQKAAAGECGSGWMMNRCKDGTKFYFNVRTMDYSMDRHDGIKKDYSLVTRDEIQSCILEVTAAYDRQLLFQANEKFIVLIQSRIRGHLARKRYEERVAFMCTKLPAITKLQSWWRMVRERRKFLWRLNYLHGQAEAATKLQAMMRMYLSRKKYTNRITHLKKNEAAVIKIQSFMRSNWAKQDYKALMHGGNPPISVVRKFVHLLDIGDLDYAEEIELEKLRQQVVTEIRSNQQLENDLNMMDIKIGLLVKNRITLQDVVSQHKTLKKYNESASSLALATGLKALSKQSRERLEAYQHLFYLLQTNPTYLARLIFEMPQSKTNKFMESVILTLYNYASNHREEFLLLKLFKTALEEEIRHLTKDQDTSSKVDRMSDIVTGNPMVVKMIVSFNRNARGQGTLRELLNPLVRAIIDDRNLNINTNPVEVYKQWVNQMESQTGKASGLPYDVNIEQALEHKEVVDRIKQSLDMLQQATEKVLSAILSSIDLIPYGMRYMAKVLNNALRAKFPDAPEKDILKIVGNLIYYRYINSAIVAPDAFDIIDVGANKNLTNDQRRNLGSVAKILQFAASNKGFGGDSSHQADMNPYIMDAHVRFKKYFSAVCDVEEPEVYFNMDQYTDVTKVTKPIIYISIAEIVDTHRLLLEHQDAIAADPVDPLHELLDDLGDVPEVESLIGDVGSEDSQGSKANLGKTEISLTLSNKFEVPEEHQSDLKGLLIRTKRMVVDVIRCQAHGETLTQVLEIPATQDEENEHSLLIRKRERIDQKATKKTKLVRQQSMAGEMRLPLDQMKQKIQTALMELEKHDMVSNKDNYQFVINSIVQDIRNSRLYRQRRKQEMVKLRSTLKSLESKRAFYEEQIDYYNQYVKTCLDNLSTKGKRSSRLMKKSGGAPKVKGSIKYSASKLHEKGVVLEIEDLPTNQFKNVLFEISATENVGMFDVNAKFMGVSMEKVELVFQDLLQLQYEGVAVMRMYKARINVNLLIFLLNKKFYGK